MMAMGGASGNGGAAGNGGMGTGGAGTGGVGTGGVTGSGGMMGSGGASATLSGTVTASMATVDISAGASDFAHWANTQVNAPKIIKAGGPARVSNYAVIGAGLTPQQYTNDNRMVSWSGGTPVVSGSDRAGVFVSNAGMAVGQGFSYTITGFGSTTETVDIYNTVFSGIGRLTATISDGSSPPLVLTTGNSGQNTPLPNHFQLQVAAASANATLSITWVVSTSDGGFGANVTMVAISISSPGGGTGTGGSIGTGGAGTGGAVGTGGMGTGGMGTGGAATGGAGGSVMSMFNPEPMEFAVGTGIFLRTPIQGTTFLSPGNIQMIADSRDSSAPTLVEFLSNGVVVATLMPADTSAGYFMRGVLKGLPTGTYNLAVRETSRGTGTVQTSPTVTVSVVDPPVYSAQLILTSDLTLSAGDANFIGTPSNPFLIQANGHKIVSPAGWAGHLTMQNVHVRDAGADPSGDPVTALGLDVITTGGVDIENTLFEHCGQTRFQVNGTAPIAFRGNTWNWNTAVSVTSVSYSQSLDAPSSWVIAFSGNSTGAKVFTGNRVAMGWIQIDNMSGWAIGGRTDAEANVLVGPRAGMNTHGVSSTTFSGNYTRLLCPNRWTQCTNLLMEFSGSGNVVEHNLLNGGWILRPFFGEARYNVFNFGGEAYMQSWTGGSSLHHNIITNLGFIAPGFCNNMFDLYTAADTGIQIYSNTWDGGGAAPGLYQSAVRVRGGAVLASLRNNAFVRFPYKVAPFSSTDFNMEVVQGKHAVFDYADYNAFFNPDKMTPSAQSYFALSNQGLMPGTPGFGGHDVGGFNADIDPKFVGTSNSTLPQAQGLYPFSQSDVWARTVTVSQMLTHFANYYRPGAGSPLTDSGDPADGTGNDVGAIDSGISNINARFESFGN